MPYKDPEKAKENRRKNYRLRMDAMLEADPARLAQHKAKQSAVAHNHYLRHTAEVREKNRQWRLTHAERATFLRRKREGSISAE